LVLDVLPVPGPELFLLFCEATDPKNYLVVIIIIAPFVKFVVFTLPPVLFLIWSTTPDLWNCLFLSTSYVGEDSSHLLLFLGGKLVKSLTSNDLELPLSITVAKVSPLLETKSPVTVEKLSPLILPPGAPLGCLKAWF
ncbi:hypothetical protein DSO57_1028095, partial [Entomophthora muscae]